MRCCRGAPKRDPHQTEPHEECKYSSRETAQAALSMNRVTS
jgi:hypothetical protein